jgi:two-component system cell cycle sensor histidine kinase/response regulator CckA
MKAIVICNQEVDYLSIRDQLTSYPGFIVEIDHCKDLLKFAIDSSGTDIILIDISSINSTLNDPILFLNERIPNTPILLLSDLSTEHLAIEYINQGAQDHLIKSELSSALLVRSIKYVIDTYRITNKLKESENNYSQLAGNAPVGIYHTKTDGTILFCNQYFAKMIGYKDCKELIGKNIIDFYSEKSAREELLEILYDKGAVDSYQIEIITNDSKIINILTSCKLDNDIIAGVAINISKQIKALKDLKDSEEMKKAILDAMPDNLVVINSDHVFVDYFVSDSENLLVQPKDFIGKKIRDVLPENLADLLERLVIRSKESKRTETSEYFLSFNEEKRYYEARVIAFNNDMAILIIRDLTNRKNLELQLIESQKMDAVGKLAGGIAHEFNNIMTAIINYTEIIDMYKSSNDQDANKTSDYIKSIRNSAKSAADLSSQLLAFGRKQITKPELLDINHVITKIKDMLHRSLPENINFMLSLNEDIGFILFDVNQLQQVIMNLVLNAKDFMPDGGTLVVSTDDAFIQKTSKTDSKDSSIGKFVKLTVKDSGIGIKDEYKERIFEPFFSTKAVGKGTGLGLSVVYGILKQNNSWVQVKSEPNAGTTFEVYIPAIGKEKEDIVTEPDGKGFKANGERVLIIEDEENVLYSTSIFMEKLNFKVFTAGTGKEAMEIFEREKMDFDLIFSDIVLPDFYGVDLVENMRLLNPKLKVLFFSGYDSIDFERLANKKHNISFISKPFTIDQVINTLSVLLYDKENN